MKLESISCHDWDYKVDDQVQLEKDGILHKLESWCHSDIWSITSVHPKGTIRVKCGTQSGDLILGEAHFFQQPILKSYKCCVLHILSLMYNFYT